MELEGTELMDARRAAFRDRIPAELDIVGIEIPAGSRGWLLQDSIAACIVQKRVTGIARNAEVVAQSDLRGHRRCGAEFRIPYDEVTQYSHRVTHIITGPRCGIGGAPGERDANFAIPIRREPPTSLAWRSLLSGGQLSQGTKRRRLFSVSNFLYLPFLGLLTSHPLFSRSN